MRQAKKQIIEFQTRIQLILDPGEQIPKKDSKKVEKIEEQLFFIILSQNGMRQAKKDSREFETPILLKLDPGEKIPKKKY